MKRCVIKIISFLTILCILTPVVSSADWLDTDAVIFNDDVLPEYDSEDYNSKDSVFAAGYLNGNISWALDYNGKLTIGGTGYMENFSAYGWEGFRSHISTIKIKDGITRIGSGAFAGFNNLTIVTIPDSVTNIGSFAFYGCSNLAHIKIPGSVTDIGEGAFRSCTNLKSINMFNNIKNIGSQAFYECTNLRNFTIPDSVTVINENAFCGCKNLKHISMHNKISKIGSGAFYNCSALSDIDIPTGITTIESETFYGCNSLTSVAIPNNVTSIESKAFCGCSSLVGILIPDSVTSIGSGVFSSCSALENVIMPNMISDISAELFKGCSALTSITIPDHVTSIGSAAFQDCTSLQNTAIPPSVTSIDLNAFKNSGYYNNQSNWDEGFLYKDDFLLAANDSISETPIIRQGTKYIAGGAFYDRREIVSVEIPDSVISIDRLAFCGCSRLKNLEIPNGVIRIGESAFYLCSDLSKIIIPDSIESIGDTAFGYCRQLEEIIMPDKFIKIGSQAFGETNYYANKDNWENELLYINDYLIGAGSGRAEDVYDKFVIKPETKYIADGVFRGASIYSIDIPDGVKYIGEGAFEQCYPLSRISIPVSVKNIERNVFNGCNDLKDIYYDGSESGWNRIHIDSGNDPLDNANIHFNSAAKDKASYSISAIDTKLSAVGYTFKVTVDNADYNTKAYAVLYDASGVLVAAGDAPVPVSGIVNINVACPVKAAAVKIYVLNEAYPMLSGTKSFSL